MQFTGLRNGLMLLIAVVFPDRLLSEELVSMGKQSWAYAITFSEGWQSQDFDDHAWKKGRAPLGFGEPEIVTTVAVPNASGEVPSTTYFRTQIDVHNMDEVKRLLMRIRVDDGFVAYLNGKEVLRFNLPEGDIKPTTLTTDRLGGLSEQLIQKFEIAPDALRPGKNSIGIEVHQAGKSSSDLYLDVSLQGLSDGIANRAFVAPPARNVTAQYSQSHRIDASTTIPDGFLDGGRGMQMDEFGFAVSGREIIRVDRRVDQDLAAYVEFARSDEVKGLAPIDRAKRLAEFVDTLFTPGEGRVACESRSSYLMYRYPSQEVLLGDVVEVCTAGVCRHRSLLFKVLADEAGLQSTLVRGNYTDGASFGGHAWNELILPDGSVRIVDVMNPQPNYELPSVKSADVEGYLTIANNQKYPN